MNDKKYDLWVVQARIDRKSAWVIYPTTLGVTRNIARLRWDQESVGAALSYASMKARRLVRCVRCRIEVKP